jgi:hypothetical protein
MTEASWYYTQQGNRIGPVTLSQVQDAIRSGALSAEDLAWTAGMGQWVQIADLPILNAPSPADVRLTKEVSVQPAPDAAIATRADAANRAPVQPVFAAPVGYYTPAGGLPARAAATLLGHAAPAGDVGDWPLDDLRVTLFKETFKIRKRITGAANLFRSLMALAAIWEVVAVLITIFGLSMGGSAARAIGWEMFAQIAFVGGMIALYYFSYRATMRSQRWAPLTMAIIFFGLGAANMILFSLGAAYTRDGCSLLLVGSIVFALLLVFAGISWRAFSSIPKFLAQPAWCQELLVMAGL